MAEILLVILSGLKRAINVQSVTVCHTSSVPKEKPLSAETLASLHELGELLRQIHNRLIKEGYVIRDGEIHPPEKPKN